MEELINREMHKQLSAIFPSLDPNFWARKGNALDRELRRQREDWAQTGKAAKFDLNSLGSALKEDLLSVGKSSWINRSFLEYLHLDYSLPQGVQKYLVDRHLEIFGGKGDLEVDLALHKQLSNWYGGEKGLQMMVEGTLSLSSKEDCFILEKQALDHLWHSSGLAWTPAS